MYLPYVCMLYVANRLHHQYFDTGSSWQWNTSISVRPIYIRCYDDSVNRLLFWKNICSFGSYPTVADVTSLSIHKCHKWAITTTHLWWVILPCSWVPYRDKLWFRRWYSYPLRLTGNHHWNNVLLLVAREISFPDTFLLVDHRRKSH